MQKSKAVNACFLETMSSREINEIIEIKDIFHFNISSKKRR